MQWPNQTNPPPVPGSLSWTQMHAAAARNDRRRCPRYRRRIHQVAAVCLREGCLTMPQSAPPDCLFHLVLGGRLSNKVDHDWLSVSLPICMGTSGAVIPRVSDAPATTNTTSEHCLDGGGALEQSTLAKESSLGHRRPLDCRQRSGRLFLPSPWFIDYANALHYLSVGCKIRVSLRMARATGD